MKNIYNKWVLDVPITFLSVEGFFSSRREVGVISKNTAADMYGFNDYLLDKVNITIPKGYNSTERGEYTFNSNTRSKYEFHLERFVIENKEIRIYSPERTIVEIIKEGYKDATDVFITMMKKFFNGFKYNINKLYEAAKFFGVSEEVMFIERLIKNV